MNELVTLHVSFLRMLSTYTVCWPRERERGRARSAVGCVGKEVTFSGIRDGDTGAYFVKSGFSRIGSCHDLDLRICFGEKKMGLKIKVRLRGSLYTDFIQMVNIKGVGAWKPRQIGSGDFDTVLI